MIRTIMTLSRLSESHQSDSSSAMTLKAPAHSLKLKGLTKPVNFSCGLMCVQNLSTCLQWSRCDKAEPRSPRRWWRPFRQISDVSYALLCNILINWQRASSIRPYISISYGSSHGYEPGGREFESLRARHLKQRLTLIGGPFVFSNVAKS